MTNKAPTTAECIEWIDDFLKVPAGKYLADKDRDSCQAIRAKLIAAQEIAKALKELMPIALEYIPESFVIGGVFDEPRKALTAWREAGGE